MNQSRYGVTKMLPADRGPSVLAQLKKEVADLKASCLRLANQPTCIPGMQRLEREVQKSRRQYDELLERRRKQEAELNDLFTKFQEIQLTSAGAQQDSPVQRQAKQLQIQLTATTAQLHEELNTQQQYQDVVQQLKQGHLDFELQLDNLRADLQGQQEHFTKVKAQLLQVQHARDSAKRDIAAAEQELASGRSNRAALLQQLTATCQAHLQQQLPEDAALNPAPAVLQSMHGLRMQIAGAGASWQCCTMQDVQKAAGTRHSNSSMHDRQRAAADSMILQDSSSSSSGGGGRLQDRRHAVESSDPDALQDKALTAAAAAGAAAMPMNCNVDAEAAAGTAAGALPSIREDRLSISRDSQQFGTREATDLESIGCASAVECLQRLLGITGCRSEQDLMLHVQAHLRAAISLQEVAVAAAEKFGTRTIQSKVNNLTNEQCGEEAVAR